LIADVLLAIGSFGYCTAIVPQVRKTYRLKKADQFSWVFLGLTWTALVLSFVALIMLNCYLTATMTAIQFLQYSSLIVMKFKYGAK